MVTERYLTAVETALFIGDGPRGAELYPDGPPELAAGGRALTARACRCGGREFYPVAATRDDLNEVTEVAMALECASCGVLIYRTIVVES